MELCRIVNSNLALRDRGRAFRRRKGRPFPSTPILRSRYGHVEILIIVWAAAFWNGAFV